MAFAVACWSWVMAQSDGGLLGLGCGDAAGGDQVAVDYLEMTVTPTHIFGFAGAVAGGMAFAFSSG